MIRLIMNKDWDNFNSLLTVLAVLYTCVFLSVLIDLFFGVRRTKCLKIVRTSFGYRRTITKLTSYFGLMIMLSLITPYFIASLYISFRIFRYPSARR